MRTEEEQRERASEIEGWKYVIDAIKDTRRRNDFSNYQKYKEWFLEFCLSDFPASEEFDATVYDVYHMLSMYNGIDKIEEMFRCLSYLGVTHVGIDLRQEEKLYSPYCITEGGTTTIHKVYTDGAFIQVPYQLVPSENQKYQMIVRKNSNWELVTTIKSCENMQIEDRYFFLHSLKVNPKAFVGKCELDSMTFPKKRNITVGSLGIVPNEFEADYVQNFEFVKRKYRK